MDPKKDAYGQEMWANYKNKIAPEIVERNDGFITAGSWPIVYFADYRDWMTCEKKAIKICSSCSSFLVKNVDPQ